MKNHRILALSLAAALFTGPAFAGPGADLVRAQLKDLGYSEITETMIDKGHEFRCSKGDEIAVVILDPETEEVIEQGKYRAGQRIGEDVIPAKHHKDDGVKYGDQTRESTAGNGGGARHDGDDGEGGGAHSHEKEQRGKD